MTNIPDPTNDVTALRLHKRLFEQAARLTGIGAWECDLATGRLTWTEGVYHLFGFPVGASIERSSTLKCYAEDSRAEMELARAEAIRSGKSFMLDACIRTSSGTTRWIRLSGGVAHEEGRPVRVFGSKQDITTEREAWSRLRRIAEHDPLTGLANRGVFDARYRAMVADAIDHTSVSALALVDLDRFKQINDECGHAFGDECLRQVAMRLQRVFRDAVLFRGLGVTNLPFSFRLHSLRVSSLGSFGTRLRPCLVPYSGNRDASRSGFPSGRPLSADRIGGGSRNCSWKRIRRFIRRRPPVATRCGSSAPVDDRREKSSAIRGLLVFNPGVLNRR